MIIDDRIVDEFMESFKILDVGSNGGFRYWQVSGLAIIGVAASFSSPNVHTVDCASLKPLRSQHNPSRLVFGLH